MIRRSVIHILRRLQPVDAGRLAVRRLHKERRNTDPQFAKAYNLFDKDGDGTIDAEELHSILVKVGEVPNDIGHFFRGDIDNIVTQHDGVVDFLTYMIHNINKRDPLTAEESLIAELAAYDSKNTHNVSIDQLFDWIDHQNPDFPTELIDELVEGADIDGDGKINYIAYTQLICRNILKLDSEALKATYDVLEGRLEPDQPIVGEMKNIDMDKSGDISFPEFCLSVYKENTKGELAKVFAMVDTDGSGNISKDELRIWCAKNGFDSDDEKVSAIIAAVDFDRDGKINAEEFIFAIVKDLL